ncbi:MAG: hypothetical protein DWQ31_08755 [Planctomycetota bacterium]|mgnify:CR=1 FL=1|nr:MAG: hypothetical protein DWQ31_08755 [Planctomycetota bacterium]REJ86921.1 MAG: hypothetical protein DWQ35_22415 [Planctomycetota bacterium]REK24952.1 MAG: hypothetical protein DWQ42_12755 [Planctomycetota bacterium]REK48541.1 MAG: hypothetical protein DWQ46_02285 [Planctomycetota bacterium]
MDLNDLFTSFKSAVRFAVGDRTGRGTGKNDVIGDLRPGQQHMSLSMRESDVEELPAGISVRFCLDLENCRQLRRLPANLKAGSLNISGCTGLENLPEGLSVSFLDMNGCHQIESWPQTGRLTTGRLSMRDCAGLTGLPPWLGRISQLDLAGCVQIEHLPEDLEVSSWLDIAGTGIRSLPKSLEGVGLRWRGVRIDERIAFQPEEITGQEVLEEANAELRRVKMERMGFDRFIDEIAPEILDRDTDAGGERKLYRVELEDDEPLVCVEVLCPSTGRRYLLRVPPDTQTCHQAVAWTAGFDNPKDYRPLIET